MIQDKERAAIITMIRSQSPAVQDFCAIAFTLGHEEGWWLARTDPDSTVSPVHHALEVNPFLPEPQPTNDKEEPANDPAAQTT